MVNFTQLACVDELLDFVDSGVEAVNHADVQGQTGFMLSLLHGERFRVGSCCGLFAENVLACLQCVDGDDGVHLVGSADGNRVDFGVSQNFVVVGNRDAAAVLFNSSLCSFRDDVAEILDFRIGAVQIGRNVCGICDSTAADNSNFDHDGISFM